jgi:hypothetical protein
VIADQKTAYKKIEETLESTLKKFKSGLEPFKKHPLIQTKRWIEQIELTVKRIRRELNKHRDAHPDLLEKDPILEVITPLLEGKVGPAYTNEELEEIYKKGERRYKNVIPPGFEDQKKGDNRQYGDLVLWLQIIEKAKQIRKPVIFVTDERKEDWWRIFEGKVVGPRPELIEEILSEAEVLFYMYSTDKFIEHAQPYLKRSDSEETIKEIRDIREQDAFKQASARALSTFVKPALEALASQQPQEGFKKISSADLPALAALVGLTYSTIQALHTGEGYQKTFPFPPSGFEIKLEETGEKHAKSEYEPSKSNHQVSPEDKKESE